MKRRRYRYIAFEDRNLDYMGWEVATLDRMIKEGHDIPAISRKLKRNVCETFLLYLDRVDRKYLEPQHRVVKM